MRKKKHYMEKTYIKGTEAVVGSLEEEWTSVDKLLTQNRIPSMELFVALIVS